jgi:two-component system NtrC family sensor kinase
MKKDLDTHFMAARQVVVWATPKGELEELALRALPLPRFVIRRAAVLKDVLEAVVRSKIEVVLVQWTSPALLAAIEAMRTADADLEIVVVAERAQLDELAALPATIDLLGRPCSEVELARRVELGRERRYLRRSEQRRKRVEARMGAIMQAVPSGIISLDEEGLVHDWNPAAARIFGWSDVEALGRQLWELASIDSQRLRDEEGHLALGTKVELEARHKSGRAFPIELSLVALPLSERKMMCAIVEDRTEARRLEVELRQAQKLEAVGQLAAGLAHEINTPCQFIGDNAAYLGTALDDLGGVLGAYAEMVAAAESGDGVIPAALVQGARRAEEAADLAYFREQTPQSVRAIGDGVRRIAEIVKAMKSFARTDWTDGASLDMNELLRSILTVAEHEVAAIAELEVDLAPLPPIAGHGGDLNQAIFNIVRNAVDAIAARAREGGGGGAKGRLRVRSRAEAGGVTIAIADTGAGIPAAIQGRIFEPFFTTKEVGRGTGQGLAVAWSVIVERHGGRITFETAEGEGTTFLVHLPRRPHDAKAA